MAVVTIRFAKLRPNARIPSKRLEDAGYDIYPCLTGPFVYIGPMETALVPTGIASAFDRAWYMQLRERSSTGSRGIALRAGVIDSGYRGEWFVAITNLSPLPLYFADAKEQARLEADPAPKRIHPVDKAFCQAVLLPVPETVIEEIGYEALQAIVSDRGAGLMGSSGK